MDRNLRLRQARIKAGFKSAAEAARRLGVPYGTYSGHESGSRGIKDAEIATYAKALGVSVAWLAYGDIAESEYRSARLIGAVEGSEIVINTEGYSGQKVILPTPLENDTFAFEVFNTPVGRPFPPYSVLYFSEVKAAKLSEVMNSLVACDMSGQWTMAVVRVSPKGKYVFESMVGSAIDSKDVEFVFPLIAILPFRTILKIWDAQGVAHWERLGEPDPIARWRQTNKA